MFVYTIGDIIGGLLIGALLLGFAFKIIRYYYLKFKYKKCPCCGHKTGMITESQQTFGDLTVYEKIYCRRKYDDKQSNEEIECDWEFKLQF